MTERPPGTLTGTTDDTGEDAAAAPAEAGDYAIAGEHARGGQARILRAYDRRLGRVVALKQLHRKRAGWRFEREARLTARLQHPSIVPVYEAGTLPDGEPYYAMKLVEGRTLKELAQAAGGLAERLALLPHVTKIAEAIAYAHSRDVIHRDLKPSNVIIGAYGETLVIDWGLAKEIAEADPAAGGDAEDSAGDETVVGAVVGTPAYMPPEQAAGRRVDARADVYALGAILYTVLAGKPPYGGEPAEVLARVVAGPPPPLAAEVPADLRDIVAKAMARSADERYPSAAELAADLNRFQTGQLVAVHSYSAWTLASRFVRRHRAAFAVAAALLAALAATAILSFRRIVAERNTARARTAELTLAQAASALDRDPTAALAWLKEYAGSDWARAHAIAVDAESRGVAEHVHRHPGACNGLAYGPDGTLALACADGRIRLHRRGAPVTELAGDDRAAELLLYRGTTLIGLGPGVVLTAWDDDEARVLGKEPALRHRVAASADGALIVAGGEDGVVKLWRGDEPARVVARGPVEVTALAVDATHVAAGYADGTVQVVTLADGSLLTARHAGRIYDLALHGGQLAVAGDARHVLLVALPGGTERRLEGHSREIARLAFAPDGLLASGGVDGSVRLWRDGVARVLVGHVSWVSRLAFTADGSRLISSGKDGTARVWDVTSGESLVFAGHDGDVRHLAVSAGGDRLATAQHDGVVREWRLPPPVGRALVGHQGGIEMAAWSPDGREVATAGADHTIRLWDTTRGTSRVLAGHDDVVLAVSWGQTLASLSHDGTVRAWDPATGASRVLARGCPGVALSLFGAQLAAGCRDGSVVLHDLARTTTRTISPHRTRVIRLAFAPDGKTLATLSLDAAPQLVDLTTLAARPLAGHQDFVEAIAFTSDGTRLASGSLDGTVRLWDPRTPAPPQILATGDQVRSLAFTPRGVLVLGTSHDVRIAGGARLGELPDVELVASSPDGRLVAAAGSDRTVRLFDLGSGRTRIFRGHVEAPTYLAFSPDGRTLLSAGDDGVAHLWPAALGDVPIDGLPAWLARTTSAVLGRDGTIRSAAPAPGSPAPP